MNPPPPPAQNTPTPSSCEEVIFLGTQLLLKKASANDCVEAFGALANRFARELAQYRKAGKWADEQLAQLRQQNEALRLEGERVSLLERLGETAFFPDWDDNGFWHAKINGERVTGTTLRQFCDAAIAARAAQQAEGKQGLRLD